MDIFNSKPSSWGLRGDPEFWEKLSQKFQNIEFPKSDMDFKTLLDEEFNGLIATGKKVSDSTIWFEEFS